MTISAKNEFQMNAAPGEELSRQLAYLAAQDNGSVLTGGFSRHGFAFEREGNDRAGQQAATAMELLAQQEQQRQERLAALANRFDALEQAAREALTDAENDLAAILSNANRDRSGRAVFKDKDGNIRDEDGQIVDPSDIDMSEWEPDASSWEYLEQRRQDVHERAEFYERVQDMRPALDSNELDTDQLSSLANDLDALEAELTTLQAEELSPEDSGNEPVEAETKDQPGLASKDGLAVPGP